MRFHREANIIEIKYVRCSAVLLGAISRINRTEDQDFLITRVSKNRLRGGLLEAHNSDPYPVN